MTLWESESFIFYQNFLPQHTFGSRISDSFFRRVNTQVFSREDFLNKYGTDTERFSSGETQKDVHRQQKKTRNGYEQDSERHASRAHRRTRDIPQYASQNIDFGNSVPHYRTWSFEHKEFIRESVAVDSSLGIQFRQTRMRYSSLI